MLQEARDFVKALINPCPSERPTAESALFHPWMKTRRRLLLSRSLSDRRSGHPKVRALHAYCTAMPCVANAVFYRVTVLHCSAMHCAVLICCLACPALFLAQTRLRLPADTCDTLSGHSTVAIRCSRGIYPQVFAEHCMPGSVDGEGDGHELRRFMVGCMPSHLGSRRLWRIPGI